MQFFQKAVRKLLVNRFIPYLRPALLFLKLDDPLCVVPAREDSVRKTWREFRLE